MVITTDERKALHEIAIKGWNKGINSPADMETIARVLEKIIWLAEQIESTSRKSHELNDA